MEDRRGRFGPECPDTEVEIYWSPPYVPSNPPSGYHKIYNLYAKKTGVKYQLIMVLESVPEE